MTDLLEVAGLVREYRLPRAHPFAPARRQRVLHGIDLSLAAAGSLGLVGESGSGKSTLARTVLALDRPQAGTVRLAGDDLFALSRDGLRAARRRMQAVFQDPYGSLDPRMRVGGIVAEPVAGLLPELAAAERRARVLAMLDAVGLPAAAARRYPHEFSGGQRQRIAIARALVTNPALLVADEPVSALDVSVQAQVLALLRDLQARLGLALLFISHDLAVVRLVTRDVAVLYAGRVVEQGPTRDVLATPRHPYTRALLEATPRPGIPRRPATMAEPSGPSGCPYAPICPSRQPRCRQDAPVLRHDRARAVACHYPL